MPARVLVTRSSHQASELSQRLRALGIEPVLVPAIETVAPASFELLDAALAKINSFDWLLFTSANAAEAFDRRLQSLGIAIPWVPHLRDGPIVAKVGGTENKPPMVAAIGPSTARALETIGLTPDIVPPHAVAESLTEALLPYAAQPDGTPTRFLLFRAEEAREHLPETLRAAGADVTVAPAYRTVIPEGSIEAIRELFGPKSWVPHPLPVSSAAGGVPSAGPPQNPIDALTFTSSSTARNLLALCEASGATLPGSALRISIGPITSATLRELGLPPHAEAPEATIASLAETVVKCLQAHSRA